MINSNKPQQLLNKMQKKNLLLYLTYPYTFRLGEWLINNRQDWFDDYQDKQEYLLPMQQALNYNFAAYCEAEYPEFYQAIEPFFNDNKDYYLIELENTWLAYQ